MCYRQILSVAEAAEIVADREKVRAAPGQLVAVPIGALLAMLLGNTTVLGLPPSTVGIALLEAVQAADEEFGDPRKMHVPEPMPA